MATISKSYTEETIIQTATSVAATHTFYFTQNDLVLSNSAALLPISAYVKYNTGADGRNSIRDSIRVYGYVDGSYKFYMDAQWPDNLNTDYSYYLAANTPSSTKTKEINTYINPNAYFTSSNPTTRSIPVTLSVQQYRILTGYRYGTGTESRGYTSLTTCDIPIGTVSNIILNAPPIVTITNNIYPTINGNSTSNWYTGKTTANITLNSSDTITPQYGGYISKIRFEIGDLYDEIEYTQNSQPDLTNGIDLSIPLTIAGSFTPKIIVFDSRGQKTEVTKSDITVLSYECFVSSLAIERVDSNDFYKSDEGTNAVLYGVFTFSKFSESTLTAPTVVIDNISQPSVTWYSQWTANGGFANPISDWTSLTSPVTLYGKVTNTLLTSTSYEVTVTPTTTLQTSGAAGISTVLAQAFYLLSGKPGGHGLGIGMKPITDALYIDMDIYCSDKRNIIRSLSDFIYPKGSYFETVLPPETPSTNTVGGTPTSADLEYHGDTWFNPAFMWGGTWVLELAGQVHVSAGTGYTVSGALTNTTDGGSKDAVVVSHNHTQDGHYHWTGMYAVADRFGSGNRDAAGRYSGYGDAIYTDTATPAIGYSGVSGTDKNMPPYIVVYRWHRTA